MTKETHIIFEHDYLTEIKSRLVAKANIINLAEMQRQTGVPRPVLKSFTLGIIPNTSFENIVKLYKYIEEQNI